MAELHPYQRDGAAWLASKKYALLADEMGVGKSAQAVAACDLTGSKTQLVVCPAVARFHWQREFEMWSPGRECGVILSKKDAAATLKPTTVISYDLLAELNAAQPNARWDTLVVDEAHYCKSRDTARTRAVFGRGGAARRSGRVWTLTGTPAPNNASELWVMLRCFGACALDFDDFVAEFCSGFHDGYAFRITGTKPSAVAKLRGMLSTVMLRRTKEEVLPELPPITFSEMAVPPGKVDLELAYTNYYVGQGGEPEVKRVIAAERMVLEGALAAVKDNPNSNASKPAAGEAVLNSLKDSTARWRRFVGLQKVDGVVDLLTGELDSGAYEKVVLFCMHRDVVRILQERLKKYNAVTIYGETPPEKRERFVAKFMKDPKCRVFIGNVLAAGTAITLTSAHQVVVMEPDWVPGNNAQAVMRCHRIGQKHPVFVRFISLAGDPLDRYITTTLRRKTRELSAIFDVKPQLQGIFS